MKSDRNISTHKLRTLKVESEGLQKTKFCVITLVTVMLAGILILPLVVCPLMYDVFIQSTGQVSTTDIIAASGSAEDIQAAVDWVAGSGDGAGNVYIPEGTFNFVEVGEPWMTVNVPAGVNLFGATTERTSGYPEPTCGMSPNDQVIEWKTVLVMPWQVPVPSENSVRWFDIVGSGDASQPSRISDIKLVGYRDIDTSATEMYVGVKIVNVIDFRVDHCYFRNLGGKGVYVTDGANFRGVIDHSYAVNTHGVQKPYETRSVDYGFFVKPRSNCNDRPLDDFLGSYIERSVYIEDCYLSRWRHCIANDEGGHVVIRHNTFDKDLGYGTIDTHEFNGRCTEIYNNTLINCVGADPQRQCIWMRGGGGVIFNNMADESYSVASWGDVAFFASLGGPYAEWWVWDNDCDGDGTGVILGDHTAYAESGYVPYTYPHPLTLEAAP